MPKKGETDTENKEQQLPANEAEAKPDEKESEKEAAKQENDASAVKKEEPKKKPAENILPIDEELYRPEPMPEKPTAPSNSFTMMLKRIARIFLPNAFKDAKQYADAMKNYEKSLENRERREKHRLKLIQDREEALRRAREGVDDLRTGVTAEKESDSLLAKLEKDKGAVPQQVKENIRRLAEKADNALGLLSEKCKGGKPFEGGDEVKDLIAYNQLKQAIGSGTLSDADMELLAKPDGVKIMQERTGLSADVKYIADRAHSPEFFIKNILSQKGLDAVSEKYTKSLDDLGKDNAALSKNAADPEKKPQAEKENAKEKNSAVPAQKKSGVSVRSAQLKPKPAPVVNKQKKPVEMKPDDPKTTVAKMESLYGHMPNKVKNNIIAIQTRAIEAYKNISENCKKGEPFKGGEDVKYIALSEKLQKDIKSGMMPVQEMFALNNENYIAQTLPKTELSPTVNLLADHEMSPAFFEKYLLKEKGREFMADKLTAAMNNAEEKGLDIGEQAALSKNKADDLYKENPEKWLGKDQPEVENPEMQQEQPSFGI